jgi:hypothetical protein
VTLIGKGRWCMACFVCEVYDTETKIFFFLVDVFLWGCLRFR